MKSRKSGREDKIYNSLSTYAYAHSVKQEGSLTLLWKSTIPLPLTEGERSLQRIDAMPFH